MSEASRRILEMLANEKISIDEAERLLAAVQQPAVARQDSLVEKAKPRFLRVQVESSEADGDRVNIRVPMQLIRAGVKLKSLIPAAAQDKVNAAFAEKGMTIDLSALDMETLESLVDSLGELTVDVDSNNGEKVRIFCE